jgi:hypothetical protein
MTRRRALPSLRSLTTHLSRVARHIGSVLAVLKRAYTLGSRGAGNSTLQGRVTTKKSSCAPRATSHAVAERRVGNRDTPHTFELVRHRLAFLAP